MCGLGRDGYPNRKDAGIAGWISRSLPVTHSADALSSIKKNATWLMRCTKEKIEEIKYILKN